MTDAETMHMPYKLLKEITGNFSNELGRGTFGVVYKGEHEDGQEIAVKVLHSHLDLDGNEFAREFKNLTKLNHPNIVRLVGFCKEDEQVTMQHSGQTIVATKLHRALCFEFLHKGSLQEHLYDEHHGFDWEKRYTIIKGICMGLKYLHTELESPVHHLDLKPDNILLDNNLVPKIADFGLSRLIGEENTRKTISPLGTWGYCPPEFLIDQKFSKEFDIFSLGVIIIKIVCGPEAHSPGEGTRPTKFIRQVHKKWRERLRSIQGHTSLEADCQQVKKCIEIALRCTDKCKQRRPNIEYIVDQLAETEERKKEAYVTNEGGSLNFSSPEMRERTWPTILPLDFLKGITNDFSDDQQVGVSEFGRVYKGVLQGEVVAVKKLLENTPVARYKSFVTAVMDHMELKHENIAQLVSYCRETVNKLVKYRGKYLVAEVTEQILLYIYSPKGSLEQILYAEDSVSINWDTRFKIIKGICQGLHFLHKELYRPIIHTNLVPNSIWLDDNWVPKIDDFDLSRVLGQEQTRMYTVNVKGHNDYVAPEYLNTGEISTMTDIYSLGMIIMEITTGKKNHSDYYVNTDWTDEEAMCMYPTLDANRLQQVKACLVIGQKCVGVDRNKRPSIADIVHKLNGKRVPVFEQMRTESLSQENMHTSSTALLDVYPEQIRFSFEPGNLLSHPLRLTNMTDDYVAARLLTKNKKRYIANMPLYAVVPPKSLYTLVVTVREHKDDESPPDSDESLSLESSVIRQGVRLENADPDSSAIAFSKFFKDAKEKVHELTLKVAYDSTPNKEATPGRLFQYEIEVISSKKFLQALSVDVHPTEPWIMTSHHGGDVIIWDYQEQEIENSFDGFTEKPVYSVKFIERKEWLVAGDADGIIYVYSYDTDEKVKSFQAHESEVTSLAVHPIDPLAISSSDDHLIKLWDWENGWLCVRKFEGHFDRVTQVNFNPIDTNSFASASLDNTILIWNITSSESKTPLFDDDRDGLLCVQNYTSDSRQYLITGSWDGIAQIWDMERETCIETLKGHKKRITCVYRHPEVPVLITGSHDGTVRVWNSNTYRLQNIIGLNLGAIRAFGYIERFERIVIACDQGIGIVEMN